MVFPLHRGLLDSLNLHKKTAIQLVAAITLIWAALCLPFPFLAEQGYSLSTLELRGEGPGTLMSYLPIGIGLILMAIFWHQTVLLNGKVLKDRSVRRMFSYGLRWIGFVILIILPLLVLFAALGMIEFEANDGIARVEVSGAATVLGFVFDVLMQVLFFRGWIGLVAIAVDGPKVSILSSWRMTRAFRWEILFFAFLFSLFYQGQAALDEVLLGLNLNGDAPVGISEWGALFFWGVVWSLPAAVILMAEIALLTELYTRTSLVSAPDGDFNAGERGEKAQVDH